MYNLKTESNNLGAQLPYVYMLFETTIPYISLTTLMAQF